MGPIDDATDGEHPPVYLPSLNSGDNRCSMVKVRSAVPVNLKLRKINLCSVISSFTDAGYFFSTYKKLLNFFF